MCVRGGDTEDGHGCNVQGDMGTHVCNAPPPLPQPHTHAHNTHTHTMHPSTHLQRWGAGPCRCWLSCDHEAAESPNTCAAAQSRGGSHGGRRIRHAGLHDVCVCVCAHITHVVSPFSSVKTRFAPHCPMCATVHVCVCVCTRVCSVLCVGAVSVCAHLNRKRLHKCVHRPID